MKICFNCFKDSDLQSRIRSLNHESICDIHKREELVFDTNANDKLSIKNDFLQLIDLYSVFSNPRDYTPKFYPRTLIDCLKHDWDIFSDSLSDGDIDKILKAILADNYACDNLIFSSPLVMTLLQDKNFQNENSILREKEWEDFKEVLLHKNRFFNNADINTVLLKKIFSWAKVNLGD